jgi:hypothetical protein
VHHGSRLKSALSAHRKERVKLPAYVPLKSHLERVTFNRHGALRGTQFHGAHFAPLTPTGEVAMRELRQSETMQVVGGLRDTVAKRVCTTEIECFEMEEGKIRCIIVKICVTS